jgi:hypothetical protein
MRGQENGCTWTGTEDTLPNQDQCSPDSKSLSKISHSQMKRDEVKVAAQGFCNGIKLIR